MKKKQVFRCEGAASGLISVRMLVCPSGRVLFDVARDRKRVFPGAVFDSMRAAIDTAIYYSMRDIEIIFGEGKV